MTKEKYIYDFILEKYLNLKCDKSERTEKLLRKLAEEAYEKEYKVIKNNYYDTQQQSN